MTMNKKSLILSFVIFVLSLLCILNFGLNNKVSAADAHTNKQSTAGKIFMKDSAGEQVIAGYNDMISFDVCSSDGTSNHMRFCIIEGWGAHSGYYHIYLDGSSDNSSNVRCVEKANDTGWYTVYVDLRTHGEAFGSSTSASKLDSLYAAGADTAFYVENFTTYGDNSYSYFKEGTGLTLSGLDLTDYKGISFTYKMFDATKKMGVCFGDSGLSKYFGYFDLYGANNAVASGITFNYLDNGAVQISMLYDDLARTNGAGNRNNVPTAIEKFFIRGNYTSGDGFISEISGIEYEKVVMVNGASLRLANQSGLRFMATIPTQSYDPENLDYGIIIVPYSYLTKYNITNNYIDELESNGLNKLNIECTPYQEEGVWTICAAIVNILEQNYTRKFVAIAYATDGSNYYYAEISEANNARSVQEVATAVKEDSETYNALSEANQHIIDNYIDYSYAKKASTTVNLELKTTENAQKATQVIEFYYKVLSGTGSIQFAVINGSDWDNYYGYNVITCNGNNADHYSQDNGIQVIPVGTNGWHKVVVCLSELTTAVEDPSSITEFDTIFFNKNNMNCEILVSDLTVRDATLEDHCYFFAGNNNGNAIEYTFKDAVENNGNVISFYYKPLVTPVSGDQLYIQVKPIGLYPKIATDSLTVLERAAWTTVVAVNEGEYDGWYKVTLTYDVSGADYTGFYLRYTIGQYFIGGFESNN